MEVATFKDFFLCDFELSPWHFLHLVFENVYIDHSKHNNFTILLEGLEFLNPLFKNLQKLLVILELTHIMNA